jgi:DNA-binding IclR family transcriptional regulator
VLAALNVSTHAGRVTVEEMEREFLPHLLRAARLVGERLTIR